MRTILRLTAVLCVLAVALALPAIASAQAVQPSSFVITPTTVPRGTCYVMSVPNGADMLLDIQYTYENGPVQTALRWPKLDGSGRAEACPNEVTPLGVYRFVAVKNNLSSEWIPVGIDVTVTLPQQPTFLSVSPEYVSPGGCYTIAIENAPGATVDVQYSLNTGEVITLRGWPKLDQAGRAYACASEGTELGVYAFHAVRNTLKTEWVPVTGAAVTAINPDLNALQAALEPIPSVIDRAISTYGRKLITGEIVDSRSLGDRTSFLFDGTPQETNPLTLLRQGKTKVQAVWTQNPPSTVTHRLGTDGTSSWHSVSPPGLSTVANGPDLQFIETLTSRSIETLFQYQTEGLILRDLGVNGTARVIEAEDRSGRRTSYFIEVDTAIISKIEFIVSQGVTIGGQWVPIVGSFRFSDFRNVQGVLTPFRMQFYVDNRLEIDHRFTSVTYNVAIPNSVFDVFGGP